MKNNFKKFLYVIFTSIFIFLCTYFILGNFLYSFNRDFLYQIKTITQNDVHKDIVVVEIDNNSLLNLWYPLSRDKYVTFLDNLNAWSPAAIWIDILFADKSNSPENDIKLAKKFSELTNIVNGFWILNSKPQLPYTLFRDKVELWFFKPKVDRNTQKVYSIEPILNFWNKYYEAFSLAVLRKYYNYIYNQDLKELDTDLSKNEYNLFSWVINKTIPLDKQKELVINFHDPRKFTRLSFYDIYNNNFDNSQLKDKIVLIWFTAQGLDDFSVPGLWTVKWIYIHANAVNNVLQENYILSVEENYEYIISFILILLLVYLNIFHLKHAKFLWITLGSFFLFVIVFFLYLVLFISTYNTTWNYIIPNKPYEFVLMLFLSFFATSVIKYFIEDKNKVRLSKALSEYVSENIAREVLTSSWQVNLNWENKKISIFFSDIAWFTTISEKLTPEELVSFLKVYLWEMSHIILDRKWFINKYEWDAIMALWWVFGEVEHYWVVDACNACLAQQTALKVLNKQFEANNQDTLRVRMWLHTWPAIIWNIWAEWRKMEFTALWDSVNLASRLEWVNKFYNTNICVSEDVVEEVKDKFIFRYLDEIKVKWKNNAIKIYELISKAWEESDFQKDIISKFENAINLYQNQDFKEACKIFNELEILWDWPSQVYKKRCEDFISWDKEFNWITTMDEK